MGVADYHRKRRFTRTDEPKGTTGKSIAGRKSPGQGRPLFAAFSISLADATSTGDAISVHRLIDHIVREQVRQFEDRQQQRTFLRVIDGARRCAGSGKIEVGQSDVPLQPVDGDALIETSHQAFGR